mmetsp:Transcript_66931/g.81961  ORF Transcript_66931/g.81961 Transcript_66931/m.81961 type:complete len:235 (-) Transcript_66931:29-733(-)
MADVLVENGQLVGYKCTSNVFYNDMYTSVNTNSININSSNIKRKIFISILGLYECWQSLSSFDVEYSLLLLQTKPSWIFNKIRDDNNVFYALKLYKSTDFIQFIQYKYLQGLCVCMLNDIPNNIPFSNNISNIYHLISNKICELSDPLSGTHYQPLNLDPNYWLNNNNNDILSEIIYVNCKYKCIKHIINDSNNLLDVVIKDGSNNSDNESIFRPALDSDNNSIWWISDDYFDD